MKKVLWLLRLVVLAFCFFDPARVNAAISTGSATVTVATSFNIGQANSTGLNPTLVGQSFNTGLAFTGIGAGANSFNEVYCAVGTISAASSVTLDLYGSLTDQLGNTINFARIKSTCGSRPAAIACTSAISRCTLAFSSARCSGEIPA